MLAAARRRRGHEKLPSDDLEATSDDLEAISGMAADDLGPISGRHEMDDLESLEMELEAKPKPAGMQANDAAGPQGRACLPDVNDELDELRMKGDELRMELERLEGSPFGTGVGESDQCERHKCDEEQHIF